MGAGKAWSEEDLLYLESSWGKTKISTIAKKLGRTETAVKVKAFKLGLSSMLDNKDFLIAKELEDILGTDRKTIKRHIDERGLKARNKKLASKYYVVIEYEDLIEWMKLNTKYWNGAKVDTESLLAMGLDRNLLMKKKEEDTKKMQLKSFTSSEIEKLIELYKEGYTYEDIAKKLNKSKDAVHYKLTYLSEKGEVVRDRGNARGLIRRTSRANYGWTKEQDRKLVVMFLEGKTLREIALEVGKTYAATKSRSQVLTKLMREGRLYENLQV